MNISSRSSLADPLAEALGEAEVEEKFTTFGFAPFVSQPAEMGKKIEADYKRYGEIAKRAKMALD